jgi:hypothetical protein
MTNDTPNQVNARQALASLRTDLRMAPHHSLPGDMLWRSVNAACNGSRETMEELQGMIVCAIVLVRTEDRPLGFVGFSDFAQNAIYEHVLQVLDRLDSHFVD